MPITTAIPLQGPTGPLYHYTSHSGFLGIVRTKSIWASSIHFQNDTEEFVLAINVARDALENLGAKCSDPNERKLLERLNRALDQIAKVHIYVASFSDNGDLLSQWRGYCPKGSGISVGFNYDLLKAVVNAQGFFLAPCIYDRPTQHKIMQELIEETIALFHTGLSRNPNDIDNLVEDSAMIFMNQFATRAPIIKHTTFHEEREWRAISEPKATYHPQLAFREGPLRLIPYFILQLTITPNDSIPVCEVIIGPNPHQTLAWEAATMLMLHENVKGFKVHASKIPYRGW